MRIISIILLLAMIAFTIISCANSENEKVLNGGGNESSKVEETADLPISESPEIKNFGGYDFRIMAFENKNAKLYVTNEMNGDTINDAVYIRNRAVEEKYNITISLVFYEDNNDALVSALTKNVQADIDIGDIALMKARSLFPVAQEGFYIIGSILTKSDWISLGGIKIL